MSRDNNNDDKNKIRRKKVSSSSNNDVTNHTSKDNYKKVSSKPKKHKKRSKIKIFGMAILLMLVTAVAIGSALVFSSLRNTEVITKALLDQKTNNKTILKYSDGSTLAEAETGHKKIPLKKLNNETVKNALVSIEDSRFYEHNGVDLKGLARSTVKTLTGNKQGGSTIPMQVSKLLLTSQKQTLTRKIQDIYYAYEMSKVVSKDDILLTYLNNMYVGNSFYGIEAAAQGYFNKSAEKLTLPEAAMLVGATNNPYKYAPYTKAKLDGNEQRSDLENKLLFYTHTENDGYDDPTEVELNMVDKLYSWGLITDQDTYSQLKQGKMIVRKAVFNTNAVGRAKTVLGKMKEFGYISQSEYDQACIDAANVKIQVPKTMQKVVSTVEDYVYYEVINALKDQGYTQEEANNLYYNGGLQIQTTIDSSMQAELEAQYNNSANFPSNSITDANGITQPQSGMVIIDYHNGQIKSLIGGRNIKGKRTLNRATNPVQPGSTIKPLSIYTAAIDTLQMTQSTVFSDARGGYKFEKNKKWNPSTTTAGAGNMSLRLGLAKSSNTVAVKTAENLGDTYEDCIDVMMDYLKNFGITSVVDSKTSNSNTTDRTFPSLALGGMAYGISPLEMSAAYGALANGGVYIEPTVFTTVSTYNGELIVKSTPEEHRVVDEEVAYVMTDMLKAVVTEGTGKEASLGEMPVAGKTGTTNKKYAVWFVGYTPYYVCSTYLGDDVGRKDADGNAIALRPIDESSTAAAKLWASVMKPIHQNLEVIDFEKPSGISFYKINLTDGGLSNSGSNAAFVNGTSPTRTSSHTTTIQDNSNSQDENSSGSPSAGDGDNPPDNNSGNNGGNNDNGGANTTPDNGGNTTTPDNGGGATTPDAGGTTPTE
ncbi:transglycosylase domain-containing protein [Intestinibacter bartlettii]|uniref:Transglycosylase domain-containing protein n=1 Tax=Intestinibacter bartlettii TaxID=261299 RepID=A0ABS6DVK0_9FIRM|nr:transglycosylase domain-containing protein [Intestinibacter bartlettii]MBU5335639.1 transglycosylase domain-containing protein [Intestinibacter bartlettii]MDO5009889.1 transglycosylase domain-containing protein [Intestinibacter bartlettii]